MSAPPNPLPPISDLGVREKLAQLVFVRIGSNLPPVRRVEEDETRIASLLESCPVGGLLLFNGGSTSRAALDRLQAISRTPLLVASDIERGVGQQVKSYTLFPHAMAFDRVEDRIGMVRRYAQALALEARQAGIHIAFAPVADANTNPKNPIIATRAYSETPERAAELTRAFVEAAEEAGLLTTAKHFPGHGDTQQDSHDSLPTVGRSREVLSSCEIVPFRAAIDAGCSLMMTAHVAYPELDSTGLPATLSPTILQDLLRTELGFNGVVCSDSLLMAGVRDRFITEEEMSLDTLLAGVDLLLDLREPERVVDFLCKSVDDGKLPQERVDEAFERLWSLKQRVFADDRALQGQVGDELARVPAFAAEVARNAIQVSSEQGSAAARFDVRKPLVAILLKPFETAIDPPEQPLAASLRDLFPDLQYIQLGPHSDSASYERANQLAASAEQLLLAMIVRPAAWHAFGLRAEQTKFVRRIIRQRDDVVLASLGVPYALEDFPNAAVRICCYSDVPVSQQALADYLAAKS